LPLDFQERFQMSNFKQFSDLVAATFLEMSKGELFDAGPQGDEEVRAKFRDELWDVYLNSFPEGTNQIHVKNREYDCATCRNFIRNVASAVSIAPDYTRTTIFSKWKQLDFPYREVAQALDQFVRQQPLTQVFRREMAAYGAPVTRGRTEAGTTYSWHHFHGKIAGAHFTRQVGSVRGENQGHIDVFTRGLKELTKSSITTVLDLIKDDLLYRGAEHKDVILAFRELRKEYRTLETDAEREAFILLNFSKFGARIRNSAIGKLLVDLSADVPLEEAVALFENSVSGTNYKRTTALVTPKMIADAQATIKDMGLESALARRHATLADVSVNDVLWVDADAKRRMKDSSPMGVLEAMKAERSTPKVNKERAITISIAEFMESVAPRAKSMLMFVESQHQANFASITAPVHDDAGQLFRWDNNFAWSYDGNVADSIKEKVKKAGGNVDGALRFSLAWFNKDDLDLHLLTPAGNHIYFNDRRRDGGFLDVDANGQNGIRPDPVENIAFTKPLNGTYTVRVDQFNRRETDKVGFTMEIADTKRSFQISYDRPVVGTLEIGTFEFRNGEIVNSRLIDPHLVGRGISSEKWGISTETLVPINTIMLSPNYWTGNAVGNKHWFFLLEGCKNPEPTRGIYNEFLLPKLDKHRKVFEVLGNMTKCPVTDEQLSGLGFSSTKRDQVTVVAQVGTGHMTYNITF